MERLAAGIMSGTSLDGIDVSIAKISGTGKDTIINEIISKTYEWPNHMIDKIKLAMDLETSNVQLITSLNFELGKYFGNSVVKLCKEANIPLSDLDFVASHGQTIWHQTKDDGQIVKSTMQLGEGSVISELTKTTVISNFRARDIAVGGDGAPLVPFVDELLFQKMDKTIALHNLGGISNTTIISKNKIDKLAFDTGPANMMIDFAMKNLYDLSYDDKGEVARNGKLIKSLHEDLLSFDYFKKKPPKSTGRELFGDHLTQEILRSHRNYAKQDIVHTLTKVTIDSIVESYKKLSDRYDDLSEIIFSGGGSHNDYILESISNALPNIKVSKIDQYGISSDYKEALAFIILGNQTLNRLPSNATYATGALKNVILGQIIYY